MTTGNKLGNVSDPGVGTGDELGAVGIDVETSGDTATGAAVPPNGSSSVNRTGRMVTPPRLPIVMTTRKPNRDPAAHAALDVIRE